MAKVQVEKPFGKWLKGFSMVFVKRLKTAR
jgi:hypothetical protein